MPKIKVSVVIPVYNASAFIEKSYHSIINQQITDFEIIYVDNNSTDQSVKEILKLKEQDARVSLHYQKKQGAGPTRNLGIEKAKGDYIYLLDVDDEVYPNALKQMRAVLERYPEVDAVFGKMRKSFKVISETTQTNNDTLEVTLRKKPYWGLRWFSNLKYVVGPPAFLYRASVFKRIGAYNTELRLGQDTAFDIKLGMLCNVAFLDMYVYLYLKHDSSTTQNAKKNTPRAFMVWPRLVKEHLPFYLEHAVPHRFKTLLFAQIYQSMGRQILFTHRFQDRMDLKKRLLSEVEAIKVPFLIQFSLSILVFFPFENLGKIYRYYLVRRIIKKLKD